MTTNGSGAERTRRARYLTEVWSTPEQFATSEEFIDALGEALDDLCIAWGRPLPDLDKMKETKWQQS